MTASSPTLNPFAIKDCALVAIATGKKAQNLRELRDSLHTIAAGSIYYHFWGNLLRPRFDDPQFNNDFATWAHYSLHDDTLAERLAIIDPTEFEDLESLRQELIEIIEQRLDEIEWPTWVRGDRQFHFIRSQIVVFDTHLLIEEPQELVDVLHRMSIGSIYYHFIDARLRTPTGRDDFSVWLNDFGETYRDLCSQLDCIDPYFVPLRELRRHLTDTFVTYFRGVSQ